MNVGKLVVGVGCVYELAALPERSPLPTLTAISTRPRRHPLPWLIALGWVVTTLVHFRPRSAS